MQANLRLLTFTLCKGGSHCEVWGIEITGSDLLLERIPLAAVLRRKCAGAKGTQEDL